MGECSSTSHPNMTRLLEALILLVIAFAFAEFANTNKEQNFLHGVEDGKKINKEENLVSAIGDAVKKTLLNKREALPEAKKDGDKKKHKNKNKRNNNKSPKKEKKKKQSGKRKRNRSKKNQGRNRNSVKKNRKNKQTGR